VAFNKARGELYVLSPRTGVVATLPVAGSGDVTAARTYTRTEFKDAAGVAFDPSAEQVYVAAQAAAAVVGFPRLTSGSGAPPQVITATAMTVPSGIDFDPGDGDHGAQVVVSDSQAIFAFASDANGATTPARTATNSVAATQALALDLVHGQHFLLQAPSTNSE